jgi:ACT domain-containing protein
MEGDQSELGIATFMAEAIKGNMTLLLKKATDEGEEVLTEITNMQATEIAEIIYEVNYESIVGKVRSLVEKIQSQFQSPKLSPSPSEDTDSTISPTSTDEATEKEDSP